MKKKRRKNVDIVLNILERGICLGTVVLWVLFVWLEASVRLREIKTIDLCRPFAAHWYLFSFMVILTYLLIISSIVSAIRCVTLGFGFKTYLAYKWRLVKISFLLLIPYFYFLTRGNNVMYGKRMKLILS